MKCSPTLSTQSAVCPFANGITGNNPFRLYGRHKTTFMGNISFSIMYGYKLSKKRSTVCLNLFHPLSARGEIMPWDLCFACSSWRKIYPLSSLSPLPKTFPPRRSPLQDPNIYRGSKYWPRPAGPPSSSLA